MSVINSFNIRQLQVYAGLCLWQFCTHFQIRHFLIDELIIHLMKMITATDLTRWEQSGTSLGITGRGDLLPKDVSLLFTPDNLKRFNALIENCVEVGIIDLYGASTNQPLNFLRQSMKILSNSNVPLPPPDLLVKYKKGVNSWGEPISDLDLKEILDAYDVKVVTIKG